MSFMNGRKQKYEILCVTSKKKKGSGSKSLMGHAIKGNGCKSLDGSCDKKEREIQFRWLCAK